MQHFGNKKLYEYFYKLVPNFSYIFESKSDMFYDILSINNLISSLGQVNFLPFFFQYCHLYLQKYFLSHLLNGMRKNSFHFTTVHSFGSKSLLIRATNGVSFQSDHITQNAVGGTKIQFKADPMLKQK